VQLGILDLSILFAFFVAMIAIGVAVSRRAAAGTSEYFLGGNRMPWWLLSLSNAASMFDMSGTMWLCYVLFAYGLKSVFIPWLWPVFNQIFLMVYLSAWVRRSGALTGGEWISLRFGRGVGAELARASVIVFALASVIGFTSYAFVGIGKFAAVFLPPALSPSTYGVIIVGATTLYTALGGMYSVVLTDVVQFVIVTAVSFAIGAIAMATMPPDRIAAAVPAGWKQLSFGWHLGIDWSALRPGVATQVASDGYGLFAALFGMMLFKGIWVSAAGPAPNYDMQRILAARTPREASLMSALVSVVLFFPRYILVAGIVLLALAVAPSAGGVDFEQLLPVVIRDAVPSGLSGLLIAGLLAAFMSNFASTVNAGSAYVVHDVFRRYVRPNASPRALVVASYAAALGIVVVGSAIGCYLTSLNSLVMWIVSALWGGYAAPNVLKWHWWRMTGHGYFWGMSAGIVGALALATLPLSPLEAFPALFALSALATIVASLLTAPPDGDQLLAFYVRTRPWGLWGPIRARAAREVAGFSPPSFRRDAVNVAVGIVWQTALVALPIYLVLRDIAGIAAALAIAAATTLFLKKSWFDRLEKT
jgi:Na+/proline symporter